MDDAIALDQLEALAVLLGIEVRHERMPQDDVPSAGGLYRLKGRSVILIDPRATAKARIEVMIQALKGYDLKDVYIRPALRQRLEA